jgi:hypothetical protein
MSNDQGKGGSPTDDRTILDPLNAEELKALREARERFQKNAKSAIGPDAGEDLGDAPTRSVRRAAGVRQARSGALVAGRQTPS